MEGGWGERQRRRERHLSNGRLASWGTQALLEREAIECPSIDTRRGVAVQQLALRMWKIRIPELLHLPRDSQLNNLH